MTYPEPVAASKAVAISGAGPPAVIEERWKPSEKPLYRRRGVKHSAINAACGPHIMSCGTKDSRIPRKIKPGSAVFSSAK